MVACSRNIIARMLQTAINLFGNYKKISNGDGHPMLFDLRTYRVKPGTLNDQLKHYADHGYDVQRRHLGDPLLYSVVETGDVNSYIHLWQYQSAADREERRAALQSDPAWIAYRKGSAELGVQTSQNNILLKPAFFWSK